MWGQWIQSADGFLLVYDVTKKGSLDFLIEVLKNIKRGKDTEISQHSDENLPVFPMVVFGNKVCWRWLIDLSKTDLEQSRELSAKEGKLFAQKHLFSNQQKISEIQQMPYFLEGSAKCKKWNWVAYWWIVNTNIQAAFESVVRQIIRYKAPQKQVVKPKKKKGFMFSISGSDDIDEIINPSWMHFVIITMFQKIW